MAEPNGALPEFPDVPKNDPVLQDPVVDIAPPVIKDDREVNVLQFADRTKFTGGYKKKPFRDPLDPRHGYKFGFRSAPNSNNINGKLFNNTHENRTFYSRSYDNSVNPTSTEINVKQISEKKISYNQSSVQTKSRILNDVFFLNHQRKKANERQFKQHISLIPEKRHQGPIIGTQKNRFDFYDKPKLSNDEFEFN